MQVHWLEHTVVVHWEPCLTSPPRAGTLTRAYSGSSLGAMSHIHHVQVHSIEHTVVAHWAPCLTSPPRAGTLTRAYSGSSLGAMSHNPITCRYTH
ncbi:hypothetical protein BgiBS90_021284 [Biomphalaria glabrata]|nr:hypothetical protein BgiBS90_021284 [Biomphalaria glabrata]